MVELRHAHLIVKKNMMRLEEYSEAYEHMDDVLTKFLSKVKFEYFRDNLGVVKKMFTPCVEESIVTHANLDTLAQ